MASDDRDRRRSSDLSRPVSTGTGSTVVERHDACKPDDTTIKHATIVDIDTLAPTPRDALTFQKPSIDDLTRRGPANIMRRARPHKVSLRWVHLRANCMHWVEELMARVCEERGIPTHKTSEDPPTWKNPLLRKDLWAHLFHGKASDQIQTRFMGPTCTPFSLSLEDEASDSNGSTRGSRDNVVLYLPYLHWESYDSWSERQNLIQAISENRPGNPQPDRDFVAEYLHHKTAPFHDRRSLHQAYYHDFGMTRSLPQDQQVMQHFTSQLHPEAVKLIVVDQLWLWVIKGTGTDEEGEEISQPDLVITAFPDRLNGAYDSANVYKGIIDHLERGLQPPLQTANNLVATILEHCTGVFFQRQLEQDKWFLEFFAAAIGTVVEAQRYKQKDAFDSFVSVSKDLQKLEDQKASLIEISGKLEDEAFSINVETELVRDIKAIIDELSCVDYILHRQQDVVASLTRSQKSRSLKTVSEIVKERRDTWASIAHTAHVAYEEIRTQMDVKQKQANLSETRSSRRQASHSREQIHQCLAEDSARHGRVILLFTMVTIIFLPMSFLASWFGMNFKTAPVSGSQSNSSSGYLTLYQIAAVIFPVSIAITLFALVFAFSETLRNWIMEGMENGLDFVLGALGINKARGRRRRNQRHGRRRQRDVELRNFRDDDDEEGG